MRSLGVMPHVVERILAHVGHQAGIGGVYNKADYLTEKRRAVERWAEYVHVSVLGEPSAKRKIALII
jgi:hypothetical protein